MLREDTPFLYAFVTKPETQSLWCEYFDEEYAHGKNRRLSSRKLKTKLGKNYKRTGKLFHSLGKEEIDEIAEGAAVTVRKQKCATHVSYVLEALLEIITLIKESREDVAGEKVKSFILTIIGDLMITESDIVLSIFCDGWPKCAGEWITRERVWPDVDTAKKIAQSGFHIVPKSSPDGDWRLSFSFAETMLIETLSPLQHKVLMSFKKTFKYHQGHLNGSNKEIISSYHLKTIALWYFEKTPPEFWTEDSIVHPLIALFDMLQNALREQHLSMYFMPKVNLLQDVDDPQIAIDLMGNISKLSHNYSAMCEAVFTPGPSIFGPRTYEEFLIRFYNN